MIHEIKNGKECITTVAVPLRNKSVVPVTSYISKGTTSYNGSSVIVDLKSERQLGGSGGPQLLEQVVVVLHVLALALRTLYNG